MAKKIQWKKSKIDYSELSELTHQKIVATEIIDMVNEDPRHKEWATQGGNATWKKWVDELGEEGAKKKWLDIQALSPHEFPEEAASMGGTSTMSGEHAKRIQKMGGKAGGKVSQQIERTCPHCGKTIKGPLYFRYHGDKCKHKNN